MGCGPEPNHVYVLPPAQRVRLEHGYPRLDHRQVGEGVPRPVDAFFRSLARIGRFRLRSRARLLVRSILLFIHG
ncbi:MAG TPA: hypothetical protein VKV17_02480 [Bryobacteraceae bacterium]|nr:hypothetical protein [Bryobacteraceae bacterium]